MPFTIEQKGKQAVSFLLYDVGFTIYNDTVVVTEDTLKAKRKEIVAWLRASRKGWTENLKIPQSTRRCSPAPGTKAPAARSRTRSTSTRPRSP